MKNSIYNKLFALICILFLTNSMFAQFAGGTYTIGTTGGEDYSSLLLACEALNTAGSLAGDVVFEITSDLTEQSSVPLGVNTNGYTLTFRPSSDADRMITFTQSAQNNGPSGSFVIGTTTLDNFAGLTQTDNVIIDGYATGGNTRRLHFTTSSDDSHINNSPITIIGNSNYITIKNCIVTHSPQLTSGFPVNFAIGLYTYYSVGTGTLTPDDITIDNCNLTALSSYSAAFGTYWAGEEESPISNLPANCVVKNNTITAGYAGVYLVYCGAIDIHNNVFSIDQTLNNASNGIYVYNASKNSSGTTNIYNNNFSQLSSTATSDLYPSYYIRLISHNGISINIYNNIMSGFSKPISQSSNTIKIYGIVTDAADINRSVSILYNTILMNDLGSTGGTFDYVGISFNGNTEERILNNIISIQESDFSAFAMEQRNPNLSEETPICNYNLVYLGTSTAKWGLSNGEFSSMEDWQNETSLDDNSISADPLFASETNLKPSIGSPALSAGTPVSGYTTDFEGESRSETNPSIGAFENGQLPVAVDWCNLHLPSTASINVSGSVAIYAQVYEPGVTPGAGQGAGIECWIGWNDADTDPSTWTNWISADYNADDGDNDEYMAEIGDGLSEGTYYYASRFRRTESTVGTYQYGGYNSGGGNFWDGATYVSGILNIDETIPPYFQNFDGDVSLQLPPSWLVEDTNGDTKKWSRLNFNARSNPSAMTYLYSSTNSGDDWFFSPALNLTANTTYEVTFWYRTYAYNEPQKLEVKWGTSQNSLGMTSSPIFNNDDIRNTYYVKANAEFTPGSSGSYYIGWHCYGEANHRYLFIDDVSIAVKPISTDNKIILAGDTNPITFDETGTTLQFTLANTSDLDLTLDKINSDPGGIPPGTLTNISKQYWRVTVESGTVDGTYSITLDISDVSGISNPAALHLLKRDDASKIWTDYGVATSINGTLLTWTGFTSFSEFALGGDAENPLPVELTSFEGYNTDEGVLLNWQTATEVNNYGFEILRSAQNDSHSEEQSDEESWEKIGFVQGHGNS
ncbi:MAG: right-handed parallel beta-helix repeat-containing protein, partial [Melioribacteraceae bacterium]|nr:right-handed parallel beta-helix repeat-containing protein [Melioribacteraceae bacterium]